MRYALIKNRVVVNVVGSDTPAFPLGDADYAHPSDTLQAGDTCATPYVLAEIEALEARQGRAVREAALGDPTRLRQIDARIAELRGQL